MRIDTKKKKRGNTFFFGPRSLVFRVRIKFMNPSTKETLPYVPPRKYKIGRMPPMRYKYRPRQQSNTQYSYSPNNINESENYNINQLSQKTYPQYSYSTFSIQSGNSTTDTLVSTDQPSWQSHLKNPSSFRDACTNSSTETLESTDQPLEQSRFHIPNSSYRIICGNSSTDTLIVPMDFLDCRATEIQGRYYEHLNA
jgi:hypothetical protein